MTKGKMMAVQVATCVFAAVFSTALTACNRPEPNASSVAGGATVRRDGGWEVSSFALSPDARTAYLSIINLATHAQLLCVSWIHVVESKGAEVGGSTGISVNGEDCLGSSALSFQLVGPRERIFVRAEFLDPATAALSTGLRVSVTAAELSMAEVGVPTAKGRDFTVSWSGSVKSALEEYGALAVAR